MNTSITKPTPAGGANPDARPVKDVIEPAKAVLGKVSVSVQTALDEMQAQGIDSALVTNQRGELLGTVSSNEMNRKQILKRSHRITTEKTLEPLVRGSTGKKRFSQCS